MTDKLIVLTNFCCCMEVFYLAKFCIFMWCYDIDTQYKSSSIFCVLVVDWFWLWKAFFSIYGEWVGEIIILCWLSMNVFCMNLGPILFMWLVVLGRHLLFLFWLCRTVSGVKMKREYKEFIEENKWENFKLGDALISWSNFVPSKESSWIMPSIFSIVSHIDQLQCKLYRFWIGYRLWILFFWISMIL